MKNLFILSEEEKNRILNLHESATKRHYLNEQLLDLGQQTPTSEPVVGPQSLEDTSGVIVKQGVGGDPYIYSKFGNDYYYAMASEGNNPNWNLAKTAKSINAIKGKIFNEKIPVVKTIKPPVKTIKQPTKTTKTVPNKDNFKVKPQLNQTKTDSTSVGNSRDKRLLKIGSKPTTKTPQEKKSLFPNITGKLKHFWTEAVSFAIPVHIRVFYDFLTLRKKPWNQEDMSDDEIEALKQMIEYGFKNGYKGGTVWNFYDIANKLTKTGEQINFKDKKSFGVSQTNVESLYIKVSFLLGNATVRKKGNNYVVSDTYDFNNYYEHPEQYTLKEVPSTVLDSMKKAVTGNHIQALEQMASYYEKLGYLGFPVSIVIPV
jgi:hypothetical protein